MTGKDHLAAAGAGTDRMLWEDPAQTRADVYAKLFERHAKAIYNYCFRRLGDWSAAEDMVVPSLLGS